jgi:putative transposase
VKPIYTTVNAAAARDAFDQLAEASWRQRYPAIVQSWDNAWEACIPFLDYDLEIRRVLSTTPSSRLTPLPTGGRGPRALPLRATAPKGLPVLSLDPTGHGRARWSMGWKPALNAFSITFANRFPAAEIC